VANNLRINNTPGGNQHPIATKQFILDRLAQVGEDYYSGLHQAYNNALDQLARDRRREFYYHHPNYFSFYKTVRDLMRKGLVEFSGREEPSTQPRFATWENPPIKRYVRLSRR